MSIILLNKSADVASYISTVLSQIRIENGYSTDIGIRVFRGRKKIDDSQVPCISMIEADDDPGDVDTRLEIKITQRYVIGGYSYCDPDHPNDTAHLIVRDIKRALWNKDTHGPNLGKRVKSLNYDGRDFGPRIDGEPIVFAVVHANAVFAETLYDC